MLSASRRQAGFSLVEVLVTMLIVAFGLLGLAALQMRLQTAEMESYQRAQALVLLSDMSERLAANNSNAASYASTSALGTGDAQPTSCASLAAGSVARDQCEWSNELKGSAETKGGSSIGAMIGARGCVSQVQAPDSSSGVCLPGVYRVVVAWQGLIKTAAPPSSVTCGQNLYGNESYRRVLTTLVTVGLPGCS
jgi:type IV pilus assembly protein PilV